MTVPREIQSAQLLDWWENERSRVREECQSAHDRINEAAVAEIDKLTTRQVLNPRSRAQREIQRMVQAEVNAFNLTAQRRLIRSLERAEAIMEHSGADGTAVVSAISPEGALPAEAEERKRVSYARIAAFSGLGLMAVGGVVSLPVAALGVSALAFSPAAGRRLRARLRQSVADDLHRMLLAEGAGEDGTAALSTLEFQLREIDAAVRDNIRVLTC